MDRAAFTRNTLRDFVSHLCLGIAHDDIVVGGEESVCDFPLGCERFSAAGRTQNQAVGVFEPLAVHHDEVVGDSCCQSRRMSWQLCFCAMLAAWNTFVSSSWGVRPVLNTRKVSRNIRSFWLCSSFKRFLASRP